MHVKIIKGNNNGLGLTHLDAINYVNFLSQEAYKYGLAIGLKNAVAIIDDVMPFVDFAVNEKCSEYDECGTLVTFTKGSKPVFHIEYPDRRSGGVPSDSDRESCCTSPGSSGGFSTVIKDLSLDGWVQYCDGMVYETPTS
jgi:Glycoside-hydrolase family GH114